MGKEYGTPPSILLKRKEREDKKKKEMIDKCKMGLYYGSGLVFSIVMIYILLVLIGATQP